MLFTEPAIDLVEDAAGRPRALRPLPQPRPRRPEFGGELPVSALAEEIETPGEGQVRAVLTVAGNPVLSTPDGKRLERGVRRPRLHGGRRHLRQRDDAARRRDPAADDRSLERDHYDIVFHGLAVRNTARFTPAVFDKPRGPVHDWEIFRDLALRISERLDRRPSLRTRLRQRAAADHEPDVRRSGCCCAAGGRTTITDAAPRTPEGVDLGPLRPTLPERLQTPDKRIDLAPALVLADLDRLRPRPRPAGGRAAAHRPPPPARQQLVAAQRRPAHPRPAAAPAAHAPRRPGRPRARRRRARHGHLAGRHGRRRGRRPPTT